MTTPCLFNPQAKATKKPYVTPVVNDITGNIETGPMFFTQEVLTFYTTS